MLGTTQVLSVPTAAERAGLDTTAFPGDTLTVPVDPRIAKLLGRYPLPNDPQGPYGARTYATSSKVTTWPTSSVYGSITRCRRKRSCSGVSV